MTPRIVVRDVVKSRGKSKTTRFRDHLTRDGTQIITPENEVLEAERLPRFTNRESVDVNVRSDVGLALERSGGDPG